MRELTLEVLFLICLGHTAKKTVVRWRDVVVMMMIQFLHFEQVVIRAILLALLLQEEELLGFGA